MIRYNVRDVNGREKEVKAESTSITNNGDLLFLVDDPTKSGKYKLIRAYAKGVWISVEEIDEDV